MREKLRDFDKERLFRRFSAEDIGKSILVRLVPTLDPTSGELLPYYTASINYNGKELSRYFFAYAEDGKQKVFAAGRLMIIKLAEAGTDIFSPESDDLLNIIVNETKYGPGFTFNYLWVKDASAKMTSEEWEAIVTQGNSFKFGKSWERYYRGRSVGNRTGIL